MNEKSVVSLTQVDIRPFTETAHCSLLSTIKIRNKLIKSVKAACQWYKLDPGKQKEWQAR